MKRTISAGIFIIIMIFGIPDQVFSQLCPTPSVNLGNDTVLCPGASIYLDAGEHFSATWSNGSTERHLLVSEPGTYSVTVSNECGNSASDEIIITAGDLPEINFNLPLREYFCAGEIIDVTAEVTNSDGSVIYNWLDLSSVDATVSVDTSRNLSLTVTNEDGCESTKELNIEFQFPFQKEKILLATYDPSEDKNIVIFSKTPAKRTRSFAIYRGNTENDLLGYTEYNSVNLYVDEDSDPYTGPADYNLRVVDSCDNISELRASRAHRTIFLKVSTLDESSTRLEWNKYFGFEYDYFYICRGTDPARMQVIDSLRNDLKTLKYAYIDTTAQKDILYYYNVRVKTPEVIYLDDSGAKKAGSGPFVHSLSNLEDNIIKSSGLGDLNFMNQCFKIYPNPASSYANISYKVEKEKRINISVYDLTGKRIIDLFNANQLPGAYELKLNRQEFGIQPGLYILRMEIENSGILSRKLLLK